MRDTGSYGKSWRKARRTGERAERSVARTLKELSHDDVLLRRLAVESPLSAVKVIGGRRVYSGVAARLVPPKADVVAVSGSQALGISVKASSEGRVALHTVSHFCSAMEVLYEFPIDEDALESLNLLAGGPHISDFYNRNARFHPTKRRDSMGGFDQRMYRPDALAALLHWLHLGMPFLADFLFGRGLGDEAPASHVWYFSPREGLDSICEVSAITQACRRAAAPVVTSSGRGMGIHLPFGSLETASGKLVFRHSYKHLCFLGVPFS